MTTVIAELYIALRVAGVPEDQARAAAAAVAERPTAGSLFRSEVQAVRDITRSLHAAFDRLESGLRTLTWMTALALAGVIVLLVDAFG